MQLRRALAVCAAALLVRAAACGAATSTWMVSSGGWLLAVDLAPGMKAGYNLTRSSTMRGATAQPKLAAPAAGVRWLTGAPPRVHCDGEWSDAADGSLAWQSASVVNGTDPSPGLGAFTSLEVHWRTKAPGTRSFTTVFALYEASGTLVLSQRFGASGCPAANISVAPPVSSQTQQRATTARSRGLGHELDSIMAPLSEFPSFYADNGTALGSTLGFVTWTGRFFHDFSVHGVGLDGYSGGAEGGPLALFDVDTVAPDALVISPANHFYAGILATVAQCKGRVAPAQCGAAPTVNGTDYYGNDLYSVSNVSTPADCCAACSAEPMCGYWSWADRKTDPANGDVCWLKTSAAGARASPHTSGTVCSGEPTTRLVAGIQGYVVNVEPDFTQGFIVSLSDGGSRMSGINGAMQDWGGRLRAMHGTVRNSTDIVLNKLGYWTDNGGYYYGGNTPTTDIFKGTISNLTASGVNVGYVQIDPYWYGHGWWPDETLFPGGLVPLRDAVGVPLLQYANFWYKDTAALYDNKWRFLESLAFDVGWLKSPIYSVAPEDAASFHQAILSNYSALGTIGGFEIDFLDFLLLAFPEYLVSATGLEQWASGMADGVAAQQLGMQLCMGLPSIALDSVRHGAITNARASEDNFPTNENRWRIGYTAMMLGALEVMPFMDVIWTTPHQPGNAYKVDRDNIEFQAIIAALSAGPVGIGDGLGLTNASLVAMFAAPDGTLVRPSVPATPIDAMYSPVGGTLRPAAGSELWQANSDIKATEVAGDGTASTLYYSIFAADLPDGYALRGVHLYPQLPADTAYVVARMSKAALCVNGTAAAACVEVFGSTQAVSVATPPMVGTVHGFDVLTASPLLGGGFALLGELGKFVRVSPFRFISASATETSMSVALHGTPHEVIPVTFVVPAAGSDHSATTSPVEGTIVVTPVTLDADGDGAVTVYSQ